MGEERGGQRRTEEEKRAAKREREKRKRRAERNVCTVWKKGMTPYQKTSIWVWLFDHTNTRSSKNTNTIIA
jgi:hypothetical protein